MRQLIAKTEIKKDGTLLVSDDDFTHLCKVLRSKPGDMLYVRTPSGTLCSMTVSKIEKQKKIALLQLCTTKTIPNKNSHNVSAKELNTAFAFEFTLFQFIAKPQKMETIIRQAAECGIKTIVPVIGEFSQKSSLEYFSEKSSKKQRLQKIITEAREQSGSPVNTELANSMTLEEACNFWKQKDNSLAFALYEIENTTETIHQKIKETVSEKQIKHFALAVGSEGGISSREIETLQKAGFTPIHFRTNILRCETAALYGIAILQDAAFSERAK